MQNGNQPVCNGFASTKCNKCIRLFCVLLVRLFFILFIFCKSIPSFDSAIADEVETVAIAKHATLLEEAV